MSSAEVWTRWKASDRSFPEEHSLNADFNTISWLHWVSRWNVNYDLFLCMDVCACLGEGHVCAMSYEWSTDNNLGCRPYLPTSRQGLSCLRLVHSRLAGLWTSSHFVLGLLELHTDTGHWSWLLHGFLGPELRSLGLHSRHFDQQSHLPSPKVTISKTPEKVYHRTLAFGRNTSKFTQVLCKSFINKLGF